MELMNITSSYCSDYRQLIAHNLKLRKHLSKDGSPFMQLLSSNIILGYYRYTEETTIVQVRITDSCALQKFN